MLQNKLVDTAHAIVPECYHTSVELERKQAKMRSALFTKNPLGLEALLDHGELHEMLASHAAIGGVQDIEANTQKVQGAGWNTRRRQRRKKRVGKYRKSGNSWQMYANYHASIFKTKADIKWPRATGVRKKTKDREHVRYSERGARYRAYIANICSCLVFKGTTVTDHPSHTMQ